jgi:phospholipid transport system substrate-binding protein
MDVKGGMIRIICGYLFGVAMACEALAGVPTDQIRDTTDKIIAIVSDPELKGVEKVSERNRRIRQAVDERFDWEGISRRALARHWRKRTAEEKREFIGLFGRLLERTYRNKVSDYSGEKVIYVGERVDGKYAVVSVKILTAKNEEISVDYRVRRRGQAWYVYDISIEGVSLVNNYRVQFNNIIRKSSYEALVERLEAKIAGE